MTEDLLEEIINLPSFVSAYGWISFAVVILLSLLFSFAYVKYFWSQSERDKCSAVTTTLGITLALLAALLLPVDVFLVSFMKNSDGTFKEWANNSTREFVEDTISYTYYSIYGIMFFYSFFILPLAYFYYEERDEDSSNSNTVLPSALLYTLIFVVVIATLLVIGIFIPLKTAPAQNSTEWEKIEFIISELSKNKGKDSLSFVVHVLTVYGMLNLIVYTGVGLASFPISLIKGFRSLRDEESILSENQISVQAKIKALRKKHSERSLSSRETASLNALEEEDSLISRRSSLLEKEKQRCCYKLQPITVLLNIILGVIGFALSIILWISLLLCNIDKLLHSLGYKMGYALNKNQIVNPLDDIMVETQKVFPLDYVLFFTITIFLVICTVSGMRSIGICCFCVPMYKIRPRRTPPQGLIMLSFILMFSVMGFHILMHSVIPTYATFGSQSYCEYQNSTCVLHSCSLDAPADECVMTRSAIFLLTFAYKAWIFSCTYYWLTWGFLCSFLLSAIVNIVCGRKSILEEAIDKDDFDDSFENPARA